MQHIMQNIDHSLCVTTLTHIWNKYTNKKAMEITRSSGIYKVIYHLGSYILLFGKTKEQKFITLYE